MTLIEALMALTLAGATVAGMVTAAGAAADRVQVVLAQGAILEGYRRAQAAAAARGSPVALVVAADSILVVGLGGDSATVLRAPGPASRGVGLSPPLHRVVYDRSGWSAGLANVTHRLTRGSASREIVVSRLGRLRAR